MKKYPLLLLAVFFVVSPVWAQIAFESTNVSTESTGTSITFSISCTGTERLIVVGVGNWDDLAPKGQGATGVTFNTDPLGFIRGDANLNRRSELWYLENPDAGGSHSVVVTFGETQPNGSVAGAVCLSGVHQTAALDANNGANGNNTGPTTVDVTTVVDNSWVVASTTNRTTALTITNGTQRWQTAGVNLVYAGSTEGPVTPAGAQTMSWSHDAGGNQRWGISAASFRPPAVAAARRPVTVY